MSESFDTLISFIRYYNEILKEQALLKMKIETK